jgi:hypothetical protein
MVAGGRLSTEMRLLIQYTVYFVCSAVVGRVLAANNAVQKMKCMVRIVDLLGHADTRPGD